MTTLGILSIIALSIWFGFGWGKRSEQRKRIRHAGAIQSMQMEGGGCLRYAVATGLAYMGKYEDVSYIPNSASVEDVRQLCRRFGLTLIEGNGTFSYSGKSPVLSIYADGLNGQDEPVQHAVFASDGKPFERLPVSMTVIGWDGNHKYEKTL